MCCQHVFYGGRRQVRALLPEQPRDHRQHRRLSAFWQPKPLLQRQLVIGAEV